MDKKYNAIIILLVIFTSTIILWLSAILGQIKTMKNMIKEVKSYVHTDTIQVDSMVGLPFFYEDSISSCDITDTIIYHGIKYVKMSAIKKGP